MEAVPPHQARRQMLRCVCVLRTPPDIIIHSTPHRLANQRHASAAARSCCYISPQPGSDTMGKRFPNTASLQLARLLVHRPRQPRPRSTRSQSRIQHILLPQRSGPCWGLTCGKETRRGRRIRKCWRDHLSTIL